MTTLVMTLATPPAGTGDTVETRALTYSELADALGIAPASAKRLAIRRGWAKTAGNDGKARVSVPVERLQAERPVTGDTASDATGDDASDIASDDTGTVAGDRAGLSAALAVLTRHTERLEAELVETKTTLDAERLRAGQVDVLKAMLEAEQRRATELREERDRWQAVATAPRGLWAWLKRA